MNEAWIFVCVISFWGWVAAVIGLIATSFPGGGIFNRAPAAKWGAAVLFCYTLWIIGMTRA